MDTFRFYPELFETRSHVLIELEDNGYRPCEHFAAVDLRHDLRGIEITGIPSLGTAISIRELLYQSHRDWQFG